jgi:sugar phosphate isomerase/epimerase
MPKLAFSTIACPEWTLDTVTERAAEWGWEGVEMRSFGEGSTRFACDPGLTASEKVRRLFRQSGIDAVGLATGVRFDAPINPPVLGRLVEANNPDVRMGQHAVDIATRCGARFVRVFPFQIPERPPGLGETRRGTLRRITERLARVCDHARNRDVIVVIENGGDFASSDDLAEIIDRVASPQLMACYDLLAAHSIGDDVVAGIRELGGRLAMARVRDRSDAGPVPLGEGQLPVEDFVRALDGRRFAGWIVYEWERAWIDGLAPADKVLPAAVQRLNGWLRPAATARASTAA